jgi:single-stranded-DNA-specific exonuclease
MQDTIPAIIMNILAGRGITEEMAVQRFLHPDYDNHLHDPFSLTDMQICVDRILLAGERGEKVVIYGDYDIDGITASAVMIEGLAYHGIKATSYIPDRFEEGYGINLDALRTLKTAGVKLVVSVDCGITSVAEATWARDNDLDLIITDHHAVPAELPQAIAVVNPKRSGDSYPFKDLCGAGVAFKVIQALQSVTGRPNAGQEKWLLDLVALGTVCDVVALVDENRVLVTYGLKVMRQTRRPGLRALANIGGIDITSISSQHLGFVLGPRMNAAGRLEHAARSLELVTTQDAVRAAQIAQELDILNAERRSTQALVFKAADEMAESYASDPVLLLPDPGWSHGIVGIVASKLVEKWHKPVLVAQIMEGFTKGSARSLGGFNMVEALRANANLLTRFGGHFFAAGYTLRTENIPALRNGLNKYYASSGADTTVIAELDSDADLDGIVGADWELIKYFSLLEPFGVENPEPLLAIRGLTARQVRKIGKESTHLKLVLSDDTGQVIGAVGFGLCAKYPGLMPGQRLTALGRLNKNEWQGRASLQLVISELRYE